MKKITWVFILILTALTCSKILREVEQSGPTIPPPPWEEDIYADSNAQSDGTILNTSTVTIQDLQNIIDQDTRDLAAVNDMLALYTQRQVDLQANIAIQQALIAQANQADKTPPILVVTAPMDGDKVSGAIKIYGAAADKGGLAFVDINVNGKDLGNAQGLENWGFALDTTKFKNGMNVIIVTAQDVSGNQTVSKPISVDVEN